MNALAVLVFAMPALLAGGNGRRLGFSVAIVLIVMHAGFGYVRLALLPQPAADRSLAVRIVQPNVDLSEKWDEAVRDRIFASMLDLSRKPSAEGAKPPALILWPETSVPFLFTDRPDGLAAIGELLGDGQTLVAGAVRAEGGAGGAAEPRYYNSVVAINDKGEIVDAVDKVHLVPFGEYLPFADLLARIGVGRFVAGPTMFSAGSERHAIALPGNVRGLPFVCYEIIFPGLVASGAGATDLLINVTNDAWFGDTPGPYQHFRQAQLRTVETGLPLIRAANTGISGVVDRFGRVRDALAMNVAGVVDYDVPIAPPAAKLGLGPERNGLIVVAILALLGVGASYRRPIRTRSR
jgi:apolipoprotein N-acyltransferase